MSSFKVPTTAEFKGALTEMSKLSASDREMLRHHFSAARRTITATELANRMGWKKFTTVNMRYGQLAAKFGDELGIQLPKTRLQIVCEFQKEGPQEHWKWIMRPELVKALEQLGWFDGDPKGYILTYTPKGAPGVDWSISIREQKRRKLEPFWWSTGVRTSVEPNSRCFLLRQGSNRGIFGCGTLATSKLEYGRRSSSGKKQPGFYWRFESLVDPEGSDVLDIGILERRFPHINWSPRSSGVELSARDSEAVYQLWCRHTASSVATPYKADTAPSQVEPLTEAKRYDVIQHKVERRGRNQCLEALGTRCFGCNMSFAEKYGIEFERCVHVHHLKPISQARSERRVNPAKDLVPLCPNCHAVVHADRNEPLTIAQLHKMLSKI